jgi:voltage-gated potassium channel
MLERMNSPRDSKELGKPASGWRERVYNIIFEADTRAGRRFDLWLIAAIIISVLVVILDSVTVISQRYTHIFNVLEWLITLTFTVEYLLRLVCVRHPVRYMTSFFGVIDLLAILPTYVALFFPEAYALMDVRILRLLRVFRVLKLVPYVAEYRVLLDALYASRRKILIFLSFVMLVVLLLGTLMYVIEGPENGFTSIPTAVYWAITAVTTVGFGDIVPKTDVGRTIASVMMLIGWGTLAVPTGILSAELTARRVSATTRTCPECLKEGLPPEDKFCGNCGSKLPPYRHD